MNWIYSLWLGSYGTKNSFTWAEIGFLLKEYWWLVILFILLFAPSFYRFFRDYPQQMEEREKQFREEIRKQPEQQPMEAEPVYNGKGHFFTKLNFGMTLFALGIIFSTTHVSRNDIMLLLLVLMIAVAAAASVHWIGKTEEGKKQIDWKGVLRFLLPFVLALAAGIIVGLFFISK